MKPRRVVITGAGVTSPIGVELDEVSRALREGACGIRQMPEWDRIDELRTRLAGAAPHDDRALRRRYPRKKIRSMGRVALLATYASERALAMAGLDEATLHSGRVGIAYGSTSGSSAALEAFCGKLFTRYSLSQLSSTDYLRFMSHTCAANLAQFFGLRGRVIPTCSACTSGSQAIGYAYEAIKYGLQDIMLAGGAEELHFASAATFDLMYATSTRFNDQPEQSPRPFDARRDGLVVGEGAGTLVLEELGRARERGTPILGEVLGFGTNCDGEHVTAPAEPGMRGAMELALADAALAPAAIDYINAHGTATDIGDVAESQATAAVLGTGTPISSTKSYTGHTLGACGAIEAIFCLLMMRDGFLARNRNLDELDPRCAPLQFVRETLAAAPARVMNNNFAFGGVNTSLIFGAPALLGD
ncbi:MAG: beta-ketoacyl-ACP synthase [Myxococcales bacterium]|nr:beta-ketoacyl-ACP synthase [Myxococcales bacterium]